MKRKELKKLKVGDLFTKENTLYMRMGYDRERKEYRCYEIGKIHENARPAYIKGEEIIKSL